jgi:hypothetical protein
VEIRLPSPVQSASVENFIGAPSVFDLIGAILDKVILIFNFLSGYTTAMAIFTPEAARYEKTVLLRLCPEISKSPGLK